MVTTIYDDARKIIQAGKIEFKGYGNEREFWDIAGNNVEVRSESSGQKFSCCCKHCSIFKGNNPFCSFQVALISYLVLKKVVEKKVK